MHTDVLGTMTLLEWARAHGARYVQVSTDEVYGDLEAGGRATEDPPAAVEPVQRPQGGGDLQVLAYVRTYGVNARSPGCKHVECRTSTRSSCRSSSRTRSTASRSRCTATGSRCANGFMRRTTARGSTSSYGRAPPEVYNVGGEDHENLEVTRILELTGSDPSLVRHVGDRAGHDRRYAVDDAKLRRSDRRASTRSARAGSARRWSGTGEPGLVGADQVRRLPPLLRGAVPPEPATPGHARARRYGQDCSQSPPPPLPLRLDRGGARWCTAGTGGRLRPRRRGLGPRVSG